MIRPESDRDIAAVRAVLTSAFTTPAEATLVDDLRSAGDLMLALIAGENEADGFVAFSRLALAPAKLRATALGPIGVLRQHRRRGIGSALVREGLSRLSEDGEDLVVVLGDAGFYERFGFSREAATRLNTPYDGPYLLAKALNEQASRAEGKVRYASAFAALE
jgi:putative acetyltransferase